MLQTTVPISESKRALLEKYLQTNVQLRQKTVLSIPKRPPDALVPLSFAQEQVWLHAQMALQLPLYNEPVTIHYNGALDVAVLERSFNEILRRHEAWRTSFSVVDGRPLQVIHPALSVSIPVVDLRGVPERQRDAEALRVATEDATIPLDFANVPLFRVKLIRLADEKHRLYLTLSHIIFDGVAIYRVFLPELAAIYKAFAAGMPSPLEELTVQYPDFACWQRSLDQPQKLSEDLTYWRRQLAGELPALDLPADRPRPAVQTFRGSMYPFVLNGKLTAALKALSQSEGVTLFQTLLAAFAVLLHRYSGQNDIPIGSVTSGRDQQETHKLLGYFLNTIVLRLDVSGDITFRDLLIRARNVTIEGLAHDSVPFSTLLNELRIQRDSSRNPLFQSLFSLEPPMPEVDSAWQLTQMDVDTGATKYDLYLELDDRRDHILARYHYSTDLFDVTTIARMAAHWQTLLETAAATPGKRLHELSLLTQSERREILLEWNATKQDYPQETIHQLFEAQVRRSPGAIAAEFEGERRTYAELNIRANQLARHLRRLGVGPEVLVGLCVERSLDMVIALLGILKAGGAYIPLDPAYPEERLALVLSDAKPLVVVTNQTLRHRFAEAISVVLLDEESTDIARQSGENISEGPTAKNLAYVIYTSGSTGMPKGVQIEHRSLVNCLTSMRREPGHAPSDALAAVTTLSFDIAGLEIFLPLITGARLIIVPAKIAQDGVLLMHLLDWSGVTVMQATPITWRLLLEAGWKGSPRLKILCGGEALPPDLARDLTPCAGSLWNLYGPTETTIWSLVHQVRRRPNGSVPIGRPIANTQVYLLDKHLNLVPRGVTGEIHIGGDGLARGYFNRPQLDSERFIQNPFSSDARARLYKTGDRGRYLSDGRIEFLGRADTQIKIRGFRVELGEIENALSKHGAVKAAVVAVREIARGDSRLVAYVIPDRAQTVSAATLREFVKPKLPEYMVPAHFVFLDEFPLTLNGKINHKSLPVPEKPSGVNDVFVSPRNEVETELTKMWETVLATSPIGITDDFFALGGHSLLAVRLVTLIGKHFGKTIPLAALLKAPTIAQLAEILRDGEKSIKWSALVPIQSNGSLPAIFCVHGHSGEVLFYHPLSRHLGPKQPFYALQAVASAGRPAHESIEEMAAHYISEIRRAKPHGPYYLAGYCFGSLVAFEMAQKLIQDGEEVAFLGLFLGYDTTCDAFTRLASRLYMHLHQLRRDGFIAKSLDVGRNVARKTHSLIWRLMYRCFRNVAKPSSRLFRNIPEMNLQAARRYVAKQYPGRMTVFLSGDLPPGFVVNPEVDLHGMDANEIDLRPVAGHQDTMLQEPFVGALAEQLRSCLPAPPRLS